MPFSDYQQNNHTHPLTWHYHRCPTCGFVQESRQDYRKQDGGLWTKKVHCQRCNEHYQEKHTMAPIVGES